MNTHLIIRINYLFQPFPGYHYFSPRATFENIGDAFFQLRISFVLRFYYYILYIQFLL